MRRTNRECREDGFSRPPRILPAFGSSAGVQYGIEGITLTPVPVVRDSLEVHDTTPALEQSASPTEQLKLEEVKDLPSRPTTVADALPLLPGIVRSPDGEIKIDGEGEHRSAFTVNSADVTDPATGKFGLTTSTDQSASKRWMC